MKNILISWIGRTDLRAVTESETIGFGPLAQAVRDLPFDEVVLLCDYPLDEAELFIAWLRTHRELPTTLKPVTLSGPTDFTDIYISHYYGHFKGDIMYTQGLDKYCQYT